MALQPVEISFPAKGIDEGWAFRRQPPGTSPDALNVRPYGPSDRIRGGQRAGLSKYFDGAVNGSEYIQALGHVTRPASTSDMLGGAVLLSETFDDTLDSGNFQAMSGNFPARANLSATSDYDVLGGYLQATPTNISHHMVWRTPVTSGYIANAYAVVDENFGSQFSKVGFLFRCANDGSGDLLASEYGVAYLDSADNKAHIIFPDDTAYSSTLTYTGVGHEIRLEDSLGTVKFYVDDVLFVEVSYASGSDNRYIGICTYYGGAATSGKADNWLVSAGLISQLPPERKLIVVSGGDVYYGTHDDGLSQATDGDGAVNNNRAVRMVEGFGYMFFVDATASGYKYFDASDNSVHDWDDDPPDAFSGDLPIGVDDTSLGCQIIALYRARVVLAGLYENPNEWYMSAVGDPFDWDCGTEITTPTQAVASTLADAGKIGDIVTCLMPYSDDIMIFGCAQSLWALAGDPAAGGMIDAISYQIGISGADAATRDEAGNLYFYGTGGVWVMRGGVSQPVSLTDGRLKGTFSGFDLSEFRIQLVWDRVSEGLHVFLLPADNSQPSAAATHWFWDRKTDSWWKEEFPVAQGPSFAYYYPADNEDDRALLLGGWDSIIRYPLTTAEDDDGTIITSYADFTPVSLGGDLVDTRLTETQILMADGSDPAKLSVYRGVTPEAAAIATNPVFTRTLAAGRNPAILRKIHANALRFRLGSIGSTAQRWTVEGMTAVLEATGRSRRR